MFGRRYFGGRHFGGRYFGDGGAAAADPGPRPAGICTRSSVTSIHAASVAGITSRSSASGIGAHSTVNCKRACP